MCLRLGVVVVMLVLLFGRGGKADGAALSGFKRVAFAGN